MRVQVFRGCVKNPSGCTDLFIEDESLTIAGILTLILDVITQRNRHQNVPNVSDGQFFQILDSAHKCCMVIDFLK